MVTSLAFTLSHLYHSYQWFSEIFQLGFMRRLLTVLKKWITWIMDLTSLVGMRLGKFFS